MQSIDVSVSKSMEDCTIKYEKKVEKLNSVENVDDNLKTFSSNGSPMLVDNKEEINQIVPVKQNDKSIKVENKSLSMEKEESREPCATHNEVEDISVKANTSVTENEISSSDDDDFIEVPIEVQSSCATSKSESTYDVQQTENLSSNADTQATEIDEEWSEQLRGGMEGLQDKLDDEDEVYFRDLQRHERAARKIDDKIVEECKELLELFGIPFITSPGEADAQCAFMDYSKVTDGTITDDSDCLLFGSTTIYKDFFSKTSDSACYHSNFIHSQLGLDRERMISLALCTGCDYTTGIDGVGPILAMEIFKEFPHEDPVESLKNFKEWWSKAHSQSTAAELALHSINGESKIKNKLRPLKLPDNFPSDVVMQAFLQPNVVKVERNELEWKLPRLHDIRMFCHEVMKVDGKKKTQELLPVLKKMQELAEEKEKRQMRMTQFVRRKQKVNKMKSKRLRAAVRSIKKQAKLSESSESE